MNSIDLAASLDPRVFQKSRLSITVVNKEKYNPRNDRTNHTWFRCDVKFFFARKHSHLCGAQKFLFLYLIAAAQEMSTSVIETSLKELIKATGCRSAKVIEALQSFVSDGSISIEFLAVKQLSNRKKERTYAEDTQKIRTTYAEVMQKFCTTSAIANEENQILSAKSDAEKVSLTEQYNTLKKGEEAKRASPVPEVEFSAQQKKTRKHRNAKSLDNALDNQKRMANLIAKFSELFEAKYTSKPELIAKDFAIIRRLITGPTPIAVDRMNALLEAFFKMNGLSESDTWFVKHKHSLSTFETHLSAIAVFCDHNCTFTDQASQSSSVDASLDARINKHVSNLHRAVKSFGYTNRSSAIETLDEVERAVVERLRWSSMCQLPEREIKPRMRDEVTRILESSHASALNADDPRAQSSVLSILSLVKSVSMT